MTILCIWIGIICIYWKILTCEQNTLYWDLRNANMRLPVWAMILRWPSRPVGLLIHHAVIIFMWINTTSLLILLVVILLQCKIFNHYISFSLWDLALFSVPNQFIFFYRGGPHHSSHALFDVVSSDWSQMFNLDM